jgi:hypothetical protein
MPRQRGAVFQTSRITSRKEETIGAPPTSRVGRYGERPAIPRNSLYPARGRFVILLIVLVAFGTSFGRASMSSEAKECANGTVDVFGDKAASEARAFLEELKSAVKATDKQKVSLMVHYPLNVHEGSSLRVVRNPDEFIRWYGRIITTQVKEALAAQTARCLFGNWQGAMIGHGELWFRQQSDSRFKIVTVNLDPTSAKPVAATRWPNWLIRIGRLVPTHSNLNKV